MTNLRHRILLHAYVTEKSMDEMERQNKLEFVVDPRANRAEIKRAVEEIYQCKVAKVNVKIVRQGKIATVTLRQGVLGRGHRRAGRECSDGKTHHFPPPRLGDRTVPLPEPPPSRLHLPPLRRRRRRRDGHRDRPGPGSHRARRRDPYPDAEGDRTILRPPASRRATSSRSTRAASIEAASCRSPDIPDGTLVSNIEVKPFDGGRLVRAAGTSALVTAHSGAR